MLLRAEEIADSIERTCAGADAALPQLQHV